MPTADWTSGGGRRVDRMSCPAELGFVMPPEWSRQAAVWMSWPTWDPRHWGGSQHAAIEAKMAEIVAAIARFEPVRVNAASWAHEAIWKALHRARADVAVVELFEHPNDDVWCRDHGPVFVKHRETGEVAVTDWEFNAWGGKFPPWDRDNAIPRRIATRLGMRRFDGGMVLEGGAIEVNGAGQLMTTEAVLLHPNRNPNLDRGEVEQRLRAGLGMDEVLWLGSGIDGDDTDGHVDDVARFIDDGTIMVAEDPEPASPNHATLRANRERIDSFRTRGGGRFEVVGMPMPQACEVPGWRLPVLPTSYVNYLLVNGGVLVPTFRQRGNDERALGLLREAFPSREVSGIDCLELVEEGGALHCLTQQEPASVG